MASQPAARLSPALAAALVAGVLASTVAGAAAAWVYVDAALTWGAELHRHLSAELVWMRLVGLAATALQGGALFFFIRDAQRNPELDQDGRTRWGIAHALIAPVSMPLYAWRFLRRRPVRN
jgi:hypothetical protein